MSPSQPGMVPFDSHNPEPAAIEAALEALDEGGVAAFPTDTVYGLGCRADRPKAVDRIYRIKGRDFKKPLSLFIRGISDLSGYASNVPKAGTNLARAFWPGPLTLVFTASSLVRGWDLGKNGTIGIRACPEPVVQALLDKLPTPLATTSANPSGQPENFSVQAVIRSLAQQPDLILDGGERRRDRPSTVVDASGSQLVLLRRGRIPITELERIAGQPVKLKRATVLFVCTGNTCRSPMAEGYLKSQLPKEWRGRVTVESCGTGALPDMPATDPAQQAAKMSGFDIFRHRSQPLNKDLIEEADLIVAMEERHRQAVSALAPEARAILLSPDGVPDPIGGSLEDYLETIRLIKQEMPDVMTQIQALLSDKK